MSASGVKWKNVCALEQLLPWGGVAALVDNHQLAVFYLPGQPRELYVLDNLDPACGAAVLARGIVGDLGGEPVVASPMYKHHYALRTGACLEDPGLAVRAWPCLLRDGQVLVAALAPAEQFAERLAG